ncbi:type II toxin-antitoxin system antitoxin SocA domain-containing protein [Azospirillum sp. TSO22-1]|uniref:Panacea domain-containing protein n=1 Tax=Azospirillum sp. TSO22-1 TaxID=716789 RepID=UPI000D65746C|nr:type II toxin-antitoxin system antitoxin SocA domain-containing protein [Azospirillum sp. TSO22-1]
MSDAVREATDCFIGLGIEAHKPLTPLEIQKMLYFLEGLHLALVDAPLFDENFQAWKFGPALPSVYRRLKRFGDGPVSPAVIDTRLGSTLSESVLGMIRLVYDVFSKFDAPTLVGLTHLPGTPWAIVRNEKGIPRGENSEEPIDIELIADWFKSKWLEAVKPAGHAITFYDKEEFPEWATA